MENITPAKTILILESPTDMYTVLEVYICVHHLNIDEATNRKHSSRGSNKSSTSECR